MRKALVLFVSLLLVLSVLVGCTPEPAEFIAPVNFYYCANEFSYHKEDGVIRAETRETNLINGDIKQMLNAYLAGPVSKDLISPFPAGVQVVDVTESNGELTILLSESFSKLTGIDLTLAVSCLSMTVMEYTDIPTIHLKAENETLAGKEFITVTKELLLFMDDTALTQEDA